MRFSRNIFESENYRGPGIGTVSGVAVVTIIFSVLSILAAILIIVNYEMLTAKIAIWMAKFLSCGFPVLIAVIAVIYFILKLKWKMHRRFWR